MGWRLLGYGGALAAGTFALQSLDYLRIARLDPSSLYLALLAISFLILGIVVGSRSFARPAPPFATGNPEAAAALGLSARELAVLGELAAGFSNKEIARRVSISPNTVKTHVARIYAKLDAVRRTDAVARARELKLVG